MISKAWLVILISAYINCDVTSETVGKSLQNVQTDNILPTRGNYYNGNNEKDVYILNGLKRTNSVPVLFPKDICLFLVENIKFAASLHLNNNGETTFSTFQYKDGIYSKIFEHLTPVAISMDCQSMGQKAYVIIVYNITKSLENSMDGSPVFEITINNISPVQFFTLPFQYAAYLRIHGNDLYLLQTLQNNKGSSERNCPIYKWSGYHFNFLDEVPCQNSKRLEPIVIGSDIFLSVANYVDIFGNTKTTSTIYKFDINLKKFALHQNIETFGAIDAKYFSVDTGYEIEHFLIVANSLNEDGSDKEGSSVIYRYENGIFVPFQEMIFYAVRQFLPVQGGPGKFFLLVACEDQETKIFGYDGWQFTESNIQFTEGSLGKGVTNMRTFVEDNFTHIVIANEKMILNETNVFTPSYKDVSMKNVKLDIFKWAEETYKKLSVIEIEKLSENLKQVASHKVKQFIPNKEVTFQYAEVNNVVTNLLEYPQLKMTKEYWNTIAFTQQVMLKLEAKLDDFDISQFVHFFNRSSIKSDQLTLNENDTNVRIEEEIDIDDEKHDLESLTVDTIVVNKDMNVKTINNHNLKDLYVKQIISEKSIFKKKLLLNDSVHKLDFMLSEAKQNIGSESIHQNQIQFEKINVNNLQVSNSVNDLIIDTLSQNALRNVGNQIIHEAINFDKLAVEDILSDGVVNDLNISKLVLSSEGNFVVNQDILFANPTFINNLVVNERINNIHINQGHLDVLLTAAEDLQEITSPKIFQSVQLLEPIVLQGKIRSPSLERMNPVSSTTDDIFISGDYEIMGNVTINQLLAGQNFFGNSKTHSLRKLIEEGLTKQSVLIHSKMKFMQPIKSDNTIVSLVNGIDVKNLVKLNTSDIQVIKGNKHFKNDLHVRRGYCETQNINGVNIENLNETTLKKMGNQDITGIIHLRNLTTLKTSSEQSILFGISKFSDILTSSSEQVMSHVVTDKIEANDITAEKVYGGMKFFDFDLSDILEDTIEKDDSIVFYGNLNSYHNISFDSLIIVENINEYSSQTINVSLSHLSNDIELKGVQIFNIPTNIISLTFMGNINGLPSQDFGSSWMLSETDQTFYAEQTFETLSCDNDLILKKTINQNVIEELVDNTVWINRDQYIKNVTFGLELISPGSFNVNGEINNLNFATEILLQEAKDPQEFQGAVECKKNVFVSGNIKNIKKLNSLDLESAYNFKASEKNITKVIVRAAIFETLEMIENLNNHNLKILSESVWFSNEDIFLSGDVILQEASFEENIEVKGLVNGVQLSILANNYFSLSVPQDIPSEIHFMDLIIFEQILTGHEIKLYSHIKDLQSQRKFEIDYFALNTLTLDTDQEIHGMWNIYDVYVDGNLKNILINGYRLIDDILQYGVPLTSITGTKYVDTAVIRKLYCDSKSSVNNVDMIEWITKTVFVYDNYTVQGKTTIDVLILYNNAKVLGTVNNIDFHENNIFLKDKNQIIDGNVQIVTKYPEDNRILPLGFENLRSSFLNNRNVDDFISNLVKCSYNIYVDDPLILEQALFTHSFFSDQHIYGFDLADFSNSIKHNSRYAKTLSFVNKLGYATENIRQNLKNPITYLSHFQYLQKLDDNILAAKKLLIQTVNSVAHEVLAVLSIDHETCIKFYTWNPLQRLFVVNKNLNTWRKYNEEITDIDCVNLHGLDYLVVNTKRFNKFYQYFLTIDMNGFQEVSQFIHDSPQKITSFVLDSKSCIIFYSPFEIMPKIYCFTGGNGKPDIIGSQDLILSPAKKIINMDDKYLIILLTNSIEIWDHQHKLILHQSIPVSLSGFVTSATFGLYRYIAVSTKAIPNTLIFGSIEIYRAKADELYHHFQTIVVEDPVQIKFSVIDKSEDLLLYILTKKSVNTLIIYTYSGISKFQRLLDVTNIPKAGKLELIDCKLLGKHFAILVSDGTGFIVEVLNNRI